MALQRNYFAELAGDVRAGKTQASARLQHDLEPYLRRIVRLALAAPAPASPLHQRLQALARTEGVGDAIEQRRIADTLCRRVVSGLAPADTEAVGCCQTVCG